MEEKKVGIAEKNLNLSVVEGVFATIFLNLTMPFLVAFSVVLGADNFQLGLIVAVLALFTLLGQIPSAKLVERGGSRKNIVVVSTFISRISWIGIALIPVFFMENWFELLLFFVAIYAFFLSSSTPAWISWLGDLVDAGFRGKYFGRRNFAMGVAALLTLIFAIFFLDLFLNGSIFGFQVLFLAAFVFALSSLFLLSKTYEPPYLRPEKKEHIFETFKTFLKNRNFRVFILFFLVWNFGLGLAAPFWDAYLLKNLAAHVLWVPLAALSLGLGGVISLKYWGPIADKYGNRAVLIICASGISLIPIAWLFVSNPVHVVAINLVGGLFWGGFNLTALTYQLDITPQSRRTMYLAILGSVVSIPLVFAPVLGGMIAESLHGFSFLFLDDLKTVFLISGIARISSLFLLKGIEEPRVKRVSSKIVFREIVSGSLAYAHLSGYKTVFHKSENAFAKISGNLLQVLEEELLVLKYMQRQTLKMLSLKTISDSGRVFLESADNSLKSEIGQYLVLRKRIIALGKITRLDSVEEELLKKIPEKILAQREKIKPLKEEFLKIVRKIDKL